MLNRSMKDRLHKEHRNHRKDTSPEGYKWIQSAINPSNKGALHRELNVPEGKKIPEKKLLKAEHSRDPLLKRRAVLAETLRNFKHKK